MRGVGHGSEYHKRLFLEQARKTWPGKTRLGAGRFIRNLTPPGIWPVLSCRANLLAKRVGDLLVS